jgi:hypothetical protein
VFISGERIESDRIDWPQKSAKAAKIGAGFVGCPLADADWDEWRGDTLSGARSQLKAYG